MRKVILLVTLSSEHFHYVPGQEAEFEADEAQRLVDEHYAKFVDGKSSVDEEKVKPLSKMTKDELIEYATSKDIQINAESTKKEILLSIENSESSVDE